MDNNTPGCTTEACDFRDNFARVNSTFLVDGGGTLARIWPKVKVKGHVDEVLGALDEL